MSEETTTKTFEPGIYLDLPEKDYFAIPAISKSLIGQWLISPADAYASLYSEREEKDHFTIGHAVHRLVLEGKEAFENEFAEGFDKRKYPNALKTIDDIKGFMKAKGVEAKEKTKPKLIAECLEAFPDAEIESRLIEDHNAKVEGKTILSNFDYNWISRLSGLGKLLPENGNSEITLIWEHPDFGLCKCRLDHFAISKYGPKITDLKTFTNSQGKSVSRAVLSDISTFKYHIQSYWYSEGVKRVPRVFHGRETDFTIGKGERVAFELLFVEKGKMYPNILPRDISTDGTELGQVIHGWLTGDVLPQLSFCLNELGQEKPWNKIHKRDYINLEHLPMWAFGE